MSDQEAEERHGELATEPHTDLHLRYQGEEIHVLLWHQGRRYHGVLTPDKEPS